MKKERFENNKHFFLSFDTKKFDILTGIFVHMIFVFFCPGGAADWQILEAWPQSKQGSKSKLVLPPQSDDEYDDIWGAIVYLHVYGGIPVAPSNLLRGALGHMEELPLFLFRRRFSFVVAHNVEGVQTRFLTPVLSSV